MNPQLIKSASLVNEDTIFPADLLVNDKSSHKRQDRPIALLDAQGMHRLPGMMMVRLTAVSRVGTTGAFWISPPESNPPPMRRPNAISSRNAAACAQAIQRLWRCWICSQVMAWPRRSSCTRVAGHPLTVIASSLPSAPLVTGQIMYRQGASRSEQRGQRLQFDRRLHTNSANDQLSQLSG